MDFSYTNEQEILKDILREFCDKEITPKVAEYDRKREFDYSIIEKLHKQKLLGVVIPKEYGGVGGSLIDQAIICEEIARNSFTAMVVTNFTWYMPYEILRVGTEENKKRWISYLFDGKKLGAHSGTEADAGTDAASVRTWAKLEGDEWVINGTKWFVSNLGKADYYFISLRTAEDRYNGMSTILVEKNTPGMTIGRRVEHISVRGINNGELIFENCRVPKENLIGRLNKGFYDMLVLYDVIRLFFAIGAVGIARGALESSIKFAQERQQFGKPIGDFQLIRAMIADMATEIDAARLLIYRALDMERKGLKHTKETCMAKLYATEMADRTTYKAIQIHGGYGVTTDFPVERYWRDARITTIGEGTSEIQRLIIASEIFKSEKIVLDSALD
ncbi:MAG: acyl-CoA dehydrogenase family protein [Syntrophaceae bacterium]|nr:acyl-CoA dehydrogenase family protein [Syntrophaceae bacterium]